MACTFRHERALRRAGIGIVAGIDEAGRGPLAGPVVAAAVILPEKFRHKFLNDSKQLNPIQRETIYEDLTRRDDVCWSVSVVEHVDIDRFNILRATHQAMRQAALALALAPAHVLIDGRPVRPFPFPHTALIDGDARCYSIAAASVIAKVTRDRIMVQMEAAYPGYGFAQHKGYATELHLERLHANGPCPIHRRSFLPVAQQLLSLV
ncbi:MAG: ribonuclease HII [Verrucomicrobiota bacterium]|nr:ribonuclease HII [Verrucomicrobiota bacterium]